MEPLHNDIPFARYLHANLQCKDKYSTKCKLLGTSCDVAARI